MESDADSEAQTDRVVLDVEEAERIANTLEMHYEYTKEDSYQATDEMALSDAEMLRERTPDIDPDEQEWF